MINLFRRAAGLVLVLLLVQAGANLEARPWKKTLAGALVLVLLGSGPSHPAAGVAAAPGGLEAFQPWAAYPLGGLPAGLDLAGDGTGAGGPGPDPADTAGVCEDQCGHQLNLDTIRCEVYQRMPALRTLCITQALAADEACMRGCEGR